ncbi:MAG: hypothetical protein ACLFOY_14480 [Desulfatibacillaceae bacterium]
MHTAVGLRLGLTGKDIENLIDLPAEQYERREWVALKYARKWTALRGKAPVPVWEEHLAREYSKKERAYIVKVMRMMMLANYTSNYLLGLPWRASLEPERNFPEAGEGVMGKVTGSAAGLLMPLALKVRCKTAVALNRCAETCDQAMGLKTCSGARAA